MLITILILLILQFLVNIVLGMFLVRSRELSDVELKGLHKSLKRLTEELLRRLPPRTYGVDE